MGYQVECGVTARDDSEDGKGPGEGAERLVKISELARMSGVPTPTIKHYLREGLLPGPAKRTSRNMAYYEGRLAARVQAIKELQKERFLPLKVIADVLEPAPSSRLRSDLDEVQLRQLGLEESPNRPQRRLGATWSGAGRRRTSAGNQAGRTRAQVLASMQIGAADLERLHEHGLLGESGVEAEYRGCELAVLEIIHDARESGMGELLPIDSMPAYVTAVGQLVRAEVELFRRRVLGGARLPDMGIEETTRQTMALSERLIGAVRDKLLADEFDVLG